MMLKEIENKTFSDYSGKSKDSLAERKQKNIQNVSFYLDNFSEPVCCHEFSLALERDDGSKEIIKAWRTQHSNHKLPSKGGIRYAQDVDAE